MSSEVRRPTSSHLLLALTSGMSLRWSSCPQPTLDHLGITHSDLEVLNAFTRVQPDAAQLYPVLGVLRAMRQKRRDVAEKAKNIALSQQRGKGSGRKLRAGGKSPKGKRKSPTGGAPAWCALYLLFTANTWEK